MSFNRSDLSQAIADRTGLSITRSLEAVTTLVTAMKQSLTVGDDVRIRGFGRFFIKDLAPRNGRHPITGHAIKIKAQRTVRFQCYTSLRTKLNALPEEPAAPSEERRHYPRTTDLSRAKVVVRISGIEICQFEVKNVSANGTCFLVADDSVVMRNLQVGREIELQMVYADRPGLAVLQRSKVAHITRLEEGGSDDGKFMVGTQIIDTMTFD